ncbi:MAG TPA: hypothetical protein VEL07_19990, partial [Planctomycetota bacterium]|nr:hypothetical protein [Planctomycetota bacterium]
PTNHTVIAQRIRPDGTADRELVVYDGDTDGIAPGWEFESCFPMAPDGAIGAFARKAGLLIGPIGEAWQRYDDVPHARVSFELRAPRFPVGITFAADSSHVLFTMDSRPAGFGPMNQAAWQPCASETALLDAATGARVWSLRAEGNRTSDYATFAGFAAVADRGALSAFADVNGMCRIVDRAGAVVASALAFAKPGMHKAPTPADGVGVWTDPAGRLAAFGFKGRLLLAAKGEFTSVDVGEVCSGCVAGDGSLAVIGEEGGRVRAFDAAGAEAWSFAAGGVGPQVAAAGANGFLVGTSAGALIRLDDAGKELRRVDLIAAATRGAHPIAAPTAPATRAGPVEYREPDTLELAKRRLAAAPIAAWKPVGDGRPAFGRTFHAVKAEIALSAGAARESFLHLVYRRGEGNTGVTVTTTGADGRESFALDLPTPEYRVVDIPVRGPDARVTIASAGPCEIAECSLWSIQWPGANMAYVDLDEAGGGGIDDFGAGDDEGGDEDAGIAAQELESGVTTGVMKDCAVLWPNTDVDRVAGAWLKPKIPPLAMVDGKRFGNGALPGWADEGAKGGNFSGAWFTIDFAKPVAFSLVATCDRARLQSQVSTSLAVLDGPAGRSANAEETPVLAGVIGNDQFWRLLELDEPVELRLVGVMSFNGGITGLSEVEIYP